jgi:hypothetical protein
MTKRELIEALEALDVEDGALVGQLKHTQGYDLIYGIKLKISLDYYRPTILIERTDILC